MGVVFMVDHPITGWRTSCAYDQTVYASEAAARAALADHPANGCRRARRWTRPASWDPGWEDQFDSAARRLGLPPDYCTFTVTVTPVRVDESVSFNITDGRDLLEVLGYVDVNGEPLWAGRDHASEVLGRALVAVALHEDVTVPAHQVTGANGATVLHGPRSGLGGPLRQLIQLADSAGDNEIIWS